MNKSNMLTLDADALAERVNEGGMSAADMLTTDKHVMDMQHARIAELEAQSERRRVLLEMSDARVCRLSERIRELEARRELWKKSEEGTLAQMAETNERFEHALSTIRELEAEAGRLRAIGEEAVSILADAHEDDHTGCRFQGATDPHVFCIACLAQEKLAEMHHAERDGGKD